MRCVQDELQLGGFVLVCVRCREEEITAEAQQSIASLLSSPDMTDKVAEAFGQRRRVPFHHEFPIVGGAGMDDMADLTEHLIKELRTAMGVPDHSEVGGHREWGGTSEVSDWGEGGRILQFSTDP